MHSALFSPLICRWYIIEAERILFFMSDIVLLSVYPRVDVREGDVVFDVEKQWKNRPAWIQLADDAKPLPRFLGVQVPGCGEIIYKAFGRYYYPFDYTNDEERRFMNAMAGEYDGMVGATFNIPMARTLLSKISLPKSKDIQILDLGCGTGIMAELLAKRGYRRLTLVDFSSEMLAQAKRKPALRTGTFLELDVTKNMPPRPFHLVTSVMLFNTFDEEHSRKIISKLVRSLFPEAVFAVMEDIQKKCYSLYFSPMFEGMVPVGQRVKYIFVGKLRQKFI